MFSMLAVSIYISTNSAREFPFLHILSTIFFIVFRFFFFWWPFLPVWGDTYCRFYSHFSNRQKNQIGISPKKTNRWLMNTWNDFKPFNAPDSFITHDYCTCCCLFQLTISLPLLLSEVLFILQISIEILCHQKSIL